MPHRPAAEQAPARSQDAASIGRALPGTTARVLDEQLVPCPDGEAGELYLAGPCLARGYLGMPDRTAERFVADPFGPPGARMYRTGDLVLRRDDELVFCGRLDFQAKIRGFRVEPGELEAALERIDGVEAAVALVVGDGELAQLAAAVEAGRGLDEADVRTALRAELPDFLLPSRVLQLERLPRTGTGKLDRNEVRRLLKAAPSADEAVPAAAGDEDPTQRLVLDAFRRVLGDSRCGRDDGFFEHGGQSLLALRLASELSVAIGAQVTIRDIFDAATPRQLAARLGPRAEHGAGERAPGGVGALDEALGAGQAAAPAQGSIEVAPEAALSPAQERMLLWDRLDAGAAYVIPLHWRLDAESALRMEDLEWALGRLLERHDSLRTVFPTDASGRRTATTLPTPDRIIEPLGPATDPGSRLRALAGTAFDLERELPVRVAGRIDGHRAELLLTLHHIASDEAGIALLQREFTELLFSRITGYPPRLRAATTLAELTRAQLAEQEEVVAELEHWRRELAGASSGCGGLFGRRVGRASAGLVVRELPAGARELIGAACRRTATTPFMLLAASAAIALGRICGVDDLVTLAPVSGRTSPGAEQAAGCCTNTVAIRHRIDVGSTLGAHFETVRGAVLGALEHQRVSYDRVLRAWAADGGEGQLGEVALSVFEGDGSRTSRPGLQVESRPGPAVDAKMPMSIALTATSSRADAPGPMLLLEWDRSIAGEDRAHGIAEAVEAVLLAIVDDLAAGRGDRRLAELSLAGPARRAELVGPAAGTGHDVAPGCFAAHFLAAAGRWPEKPALASEEGELSYAELRGQGLAIASRLARLGVAPGDVVALAASWGPGMITAQIGIHLAGGVVAALDPEAPADRLARQLSRLRPRVVVEVGCELSGDLPARLRLDAGLAAAERDGEPCEAAAPGLIRGVDDLAYVIFTSGTTGEPKLVGVPHRGIAKLIATQRERFGPAVGRRVLAFAAPTFDAAFWQLCGTLCDGGVLVVPPMRARMPGRAFLEHCRSARIDLITVPPSVLGAFEAGTALPEGCSLVVGAERLPRELAERFASRHELHNAYGPTEATVNTLTWRCRPGEPGTVPIGLPDPGARCYVLDEAMGLVPPGIPGELWIGGEGVALGYLDDPGRTAERFIASPFETGGRLYRSGDLVERRADGALCFLGRIDEQLKIRGLRVEPGEIAAVLESDPRVRQAVVVPWERPSGTALLAYVVLRDDERRAGDEHSIEGELRARCGDALPPAIVPARIIALDEIPVLPSGKADRRRLPVPGDEATAAVRRLDDDALVGRIQTLLGRALGLELLGAEEDFFGSGGSSLAAAPALEELGALEGGSALTFADLVGAPTPRRLAQALRRRDRRDPLGRVLQLRTGGDGAAVTPLFALPPLAGMGWPYAALLPQLREDRPVWALQASNLDGRTPAVRDFTAAVEGYLRDIEELAPDGPVHLLGWSFGGAIALAVAGALRRRGRELGGIVVLDAYPSIEWGNAPTRGDAMRSALGMVGVDVTLERAEQLSPAEAGSLLRTASPALSRLERFDAASMLDNFTAGQELGRTAVFERIEQRIDFVTAGRTASWFTTDWRAWLPLVGGEFVVDEVDAAHQEMLRGVSAAQIGRIVERACAAAEVRLAGRARAAEG